MNIKEKELFFELCKFLDPNKKKIKRLIENGSATPELLGNLFANRVTGIAHGVLKKCDLLHMVDREFRAALINTAIMNEKIVDDFRGCVNYLSTELEACGVPYALLKGAYLCNKYEKGYRTSNDIDILIASNDVGKVSALLKLAGFKQGEVKNGAFIPATRQQIIQSKMTRGETVPFIKPTKLPFVKFVEVDLNFSLDYKNGDDDILKKMLSRTQKVSFDNMQIRTLDNFDFVLHLCAHLYKEATTLPWIKMKRDMTFYKYCDIYMMLSSFSKEEFAELLKRANENGLEMEIAYCLQSLKAFFGDSLGVLGDNIEFIGNVNEVVSPEEKKIYYYSESNVIKRFFTKDRTKLFEEAKNE